MSVSQYIRLHVVACQVYRRVLAVSGRCAAARVVGDWERWCPRAVHGYRTKGRG